MDDIQRFVKLSKYAGGRFDLVQAGGGNTSVQLDDGTMLVKASGCLLSEVSEASGHVRIPRQIVIDLVRQGSSPDEAFAALQPFIMSRGVRPSIEAYFHALLNKFTLHTHPVVVMAIVSCKDWRCVLDELFPEAVKVGYCTPGIGVAIALHGQIKGAVWPKIVFIQNHGLIVSADSLDEVIALNEQVLEKIEQYLGCDMSPYKASHKVSAMMDAASMFTHVAWRSQDAQIAQVLKASREFLFARPFFPDGAVFLGAGAVELSSLDDDAPVRAYVKEHGTVPAVVVFKDAVYCVAQNVRKAREIEEVLKAHLMTLSAARGVIDPLSADEIVFLGHWDAEKHRKK